MRFREWLDEDDEANGNFYHTQLVNDDDMVGRQTWKVNGVTFVKPERASGDVVIMTNVAKFDKAWSQDMDMYITPGGGGNAINIRYPRFVHFLTLGQPVIMSEVSVAVSDTPHFTNGRHRYSVLRDQGWKKIPMCVDPESAPKFRRLYGI
jgi:hypothetical protein